MKTPSDIVRLSRRESVYLLNAEFLPDELAQVIKAAEAGDDGGVVIPLSSEMSEQFREVLTEYMARAGFDGDYEPTSEGAILEDLIDRFYIK